METLVLIIAAVILVAGIALWRADSSKRVPQQTEEPAEESTPQEEVEYDTDIPEEEPEVEPIPDRAVGVYEEDASEIDPEVESVIEEIPEVTDYQPEPVPEPEPEPQLVEGTVDEEHRSVDKHGFLSFPGAQRRERKAWAAKHHFDYIKEDAFLTDEWSRGAASTGAVARDVVSGMAEGYETHLVDLASVPVMAMRRGTPSEVVIDARRGEQSDDAGREESDDLLEVDTVSGFRMLSNAAGVATRLVDERVRVALEAMPESVTAVWMESDWVLAETVKGSAPADWEDMLQPLALLTDASFTLPPRSAGANNLDLKHLEPTRLKPEEPEKPEFTPDNQEEDLSQPLVIRPEEPLQMPVRGVQESRGVVEPRSLGADDVDSIADGQPSRTNDLYGTRVVRDLNGESSIFDDAQDTDEPPQEWRL
ncbi:hypothetical protein CDES_12465 [Corynebacterium deserti GIMN1.010]|uniref:Uncharacterized protein n=1 Tax=Corynebacterium deserti GIMN1.010 TaxID=931089 RepID=A0A0M4CL74_9CORY|nr:hypothetical protein [Corynebacterium deserti]ALC06838.1 hypothetical protein CDES_12465 [Corynebacterium deserti GIMN1.010]